MGNHGGLFYAVRLWSAFTVAISLALKVLASRRGRCYLPTPIVPPS